MQLPGPTEADCSLGEVSFPAESNRYSHDANYPVYSYLRKLEAESKQFRRSETARQPPTASAVQVNAATPASNPDESRVTNPLFEPQLRRLSNTEKQEFEPAFSGESSCVTFNNRLFQCINGNFDIVPATLSNYYHPNIAESEYIPRSLIPDRIRARLLLNIAQRFIGNGHHLFLRVTFMRELDGAYGGSTNPSRLWTCKLLALLALGELYTNRKRPGDDQVVPGIFPTQIPANHGRLIRRSGVDYYTQAASMLQDTYEEASVLQVEALILVVSLRRFAKR